jgi:uncharacterized protein (TIGR03437 family)
LTAGVTAALYQSSLNGGTAGAGTHTPEALAYNTAGATATAQISVTVLGPPTSPTVKVTEPSNGATLSSSISFQVSTAVSDPAAEASTVEVSLSGFGNGLVPCEGAEAACGSVAWSQAPAGSYAVKAQLLGSDGTVLADSGPPLTFTVAGSGSTATGQGSSGPTVANAASFGAQVAPGSLIAAFFNGPKRPTVSAGSVPLPTTLAGMTLTANGLPMPLLYASSTQINAQVAYETPIGDIAVALSIDGAAGTNLTARVAAAVPGVFVFGQNRAVAQNQDLSLNTADSPAAPGSVITLYFTGQGVSVNPFATGTAAPLTPLSIPSFSASATIGGEPATIYFVGSAPTFVGLSRAKILVPDLAASTYPIALTINGVASNAPSPDGAVGHGSGSATETR